MTRVTLIFGVALAGGLLLCWDKLDPTVTPLLSLRDPAPAPPAPAPLGVEPAELPAALAGLSAAQVLEKAAAAYGPDRVAWLETDFRQSAGWEDVTYQCEGRYLSAPNHRLRLEMTVQTGRHQGKLELVSDGLLLEESVDLGEKRKLSTILELPKITEPTDDPAAIAAQRDYLLYRKAFLGVVPLLRGIAPRLQEPHVRGAVAAGRSLVEVIGEWVPAEAPDQHVPPQFRFRLEPRECRVYLDAATLWPVRVEWWGAAGVGGSRQLLIVNEYGDPVLNQPPPEDRLAEVFRVEDVPGTP